MRRGATAAALAAVVALASALGAAGCGSGESRTTTAPEPGADVAWPRFGGDDDQSRFSPLAEVSTANVGRLGLAWSWQPGDDTTLWESFPVVAGGTLYVTTDSGQVVAFDAAAGVRRWSYTPQVDLLTATAEGQVPVNRGVAVAQGRVYLQTWDARLVALDADDGRELWSVPIAPGEPGVTGAGPPTYDGGRLVVGGSGSDPAGTRGFVAAFDAADGHELWRFHTVPRERGGGRVWMPPTVSGGTVYAGTGNPSPALTGGRRGCEPWTSGMVALDARDGRLRWGATEVCDDVWDYDGGQPPLVYETDVNGIATRVVGHANKSGSYWLRDAASGRELAPPTQLIPQPARRPRPTRAGTTICPGALGGVAYGPAAHDPRGGTIFQGAAVMCMVYRRGAHSQSGRAVRVGGGEARVVPGRAARGALVALDDATGRVRWRRRLPAPLAGGVLATAGGIVFSGCDDGFLYAFDADTGRTLWRGAIGLAFGSAPLTFRAAGRQYVAVVAGGSSVAEQTGAPVGARLVVLRLGGTALRGK
ncbi:PQQ-binding-like beta-propeller repeat protein [Conexibacter sp. JD483]|uniref:pyrroloquinoline quinone-dependent dehydrogenase n=1 Tax=unclassified Conexibacter TaxID=2627773 RepID=UPI00271B754D|nr:MULTISPECIES: PQQ-binding-like beta-propeller repeat protein [unclassified Conexibacter]MDO8186562.1 PQQ-binding-like beta-propeller repeat protein [Conexibacter sp. CPCC 205706]MDO8196667.1 PQQ-binding-like beta-propeller repeat protein [Conexibacter sp. CPCC 205762]MDR9372041.1 PQQ-binding-like beta-propeller repeat protein [Conexibacter sp. JD483]